MASRLLLLVSPLTTLTIAFIVRVVSTVIYYRRNTKEAVAFFHPYTNDGGGGERVLWCAVKAVQEESPDLDCVIYTGDHDASPQSLARRSIDRFGVKLIRPPKVVHLYKRKWIEETTYPRFTMIGQSLGSVFLSWEALYMLSRVHARSSMYNNDALIAKSVFFSQCKVVYYKLFRWMYGVAGSCAHLAMVNSSWTQSHIDKLWGITSRIKRVYLPCDTSSLQVLPLEKSMKPIKIISVAQFRPEKLEAFAVALKNFDGDLPRPRLQFVGSCRNEADEKRLQDLKDLAYELKVEGDVEFHQNVTYSELVSLLGSASAGIHSMIDEHFGISVIEYMASGAIPIAHNSAGPKMDILLPEDGKQTGFLAQSVQEYADAIVKTIKMPASERLEMAAAARQRASRFSEQRFYEDFKVAIRPIIHTSSR